MSSEQLYQPNFREEASRFINMGILLGNSPLLPAEHATVGSHSLQAEMNVSRTEVTNTTASECSDKHTLNDTVVGLFLQFLVPTSFMLPAK